MPDELVEQYDVVHVKLLVFVVKDDPMSVLRNLIRMLSTGHHPRVGLANMRGRRELPWLTKFPNTEPGGWLQWAEADVASMRITKTQSSNADDALQRLFSLTAAQDPRLVPKWPSQLPNLFQGQGLAQVEAHRVDANPHQEFAMHQCNLLIYNMIAQRGASSAQAKEISSLVPEAAHESKGGAMFAFSRLTVVGRKVRD